MNGTTSSSTFSFHNYLVACPNGQTLAPTWNLNGFSVTVSTIHCLIACWAFRPVEDLGFGDLCFAVSGLMCSIFSLARSESECFIWSSGFIIWFLFMQRHGTQNGRARSTSLKLDAPVMTKFTSNFVPIPESSPCEMLHTMWRWRDIWGAEFLFFQ